MSISVKRCGIGVGVLILLMLAGGRVAAQTADQTVKDLPQQVKTNGENKLVTKTNTVSNNAADKVDTLGTKAYKGFVSMFKKKKKTGATSGGATTPPAGAPPAAVADTTHKQR
jgi:hypothetical protein